MIEVSFCWRISRHFRKFRTLHQVMIQPDNFVPQCRARRKICGFMWMPPTLALLGRWMNSARIRGLDSVSFDLAPSVSFSLQNPTKARVCMNLYESVYIYIQHTDWFGTFNGFAKLVELIVLQLSVCAKSKQIFTCVPYPLECRKAARRS